MEGIILVVIVIIAIVAVKVITNKAPEEFKTKPANAPKRKKSKDRWERAANDTEQLRELGFIPGKDEENE